MSSLKWVMLLSFVLVLPSLTRAQDFSCGPTSEPAYENSEEGLQRLLGDIIANLKTKNEKQAKLIAEGLMIADPSTCFHRLFGREEGGRVASMYEKIRKFNDDSIPSTLRSAAKDKHATVGVEKIEADPAAELSKLETAVVQALQSPVPFYSANYTEEENKRTWALGYFIYTSGGFRSLQSTVLSALSNAPPMRLRVGGKVMSQKLIYKPQPDYPEIAKRTKVEGTVRLQILIGTDGRVREVEVIHGPTELVAASVEAVRQWRYQPTFLNGQPVEVVSIVDIVYSR